MILSNLLVTAIIVNLLSYGFIRCEDKIFSATENNSYSNICPVTNSKMPDYIPHKGDCNSFIICDRGIPYLKACPLGLHFNSNLKTCDYPELAGCDKKTDKNPKERTIDDSEACPVVNPRYPVMLPYPQDCSKFYICDNGVRYLKQCQPGLQFNPNILACDYPENAGCDKVFKELPKGKNIRDDLSLCPAKISKYPLLRPHPKDCSKFFICDSGTAHLKECHPGLHFNPKINTCDYPENAGCDADRKITLSGVPSPFCPSVNGRTPIFFRHSTNCSVYYMCGNGFAYEFACPSRLHFNVRKQVCDYERNSGCQNVNLVRNLNAASEIFQQKDKLSVFLTNKL